MCCSVECHLLNEFLLSHARLSFGAAKDQHTQTHSHTHSDCPGRVCFTGFLTSRHSLCTLLPFLVSCLCSLDTLLNEFNIFTIKMLILSLPFRITAITRRNPTHTHIARDPLLHRIVCLLVQGLLVPLYRTPKL